MHLPDLAPFFAALRARSLRLARLLWRAARASAAAATRLARRLAASDLLRRARRPALRVARATLVAALLSGGLWVATALFVVRIPPATIGVRQVLWGAEAGIVPRDHTTGLAWALKGRDTWHLLDARTQIVSFVWKSGGGNQGMLAVATREGDAAEVAVSVPYRILRGEAHRIVRAGLKHDYEKRAVAIMRRVLLRELAVLSTEDYFDPDLRRVASLSAHAALRTELAAIHLEPEAVVLGGAFFSPTYEKKLQEKQLASQTRRTNESIARRAAQQIENDMLLEGLEQERKLLFAGHDLLLERQRIDFEGRIAAVEREARDYKERRKLEAETAYQGLVIGGEGALAEAEALRERLRNEALESRGGRLYLAREAAMNLRIDKVTLNSNDPRVPTILDLDELVDLLVGRGAAR